MLSLNRKSLTLSLFSLLAAAVLPGCGAEEAQEGASIRIEDATTEQCPTAARSSC